MCLILVGPLTFFGIFVKRYGRNNYELLLSLNTLSSCELLMSRTLLMMGFINPSDRIYFDMLIVFIDHGRVWIGGSAPWKNVKCAERVEAELLIFLIPLYLSRRGVGVVGSIFSEWAERDIWVQGAGHLAWGGGGGGISWGGWSPFWRVRYCKIHRGW